MPNLYRPIECRRSDRPSDRNVRVGRSRNPAVPLKLLIDTECVKTDGPVDRIVEQAIDTVQTKRVDEVADALNRRGDIGLRGPAVTARRTAGEGNLAVGKIGDRSGRRPRFAVAF